MKAIFNTRTKRFKTYDGWTEYVSDQKGELIVGIEDTMLFTNGEAERNTLEQPLEWRGINPRVNWRMV